MRNPALSQDPAVEAVETREWLDSFDYVLQTGGAARAAQLLRKLDAHARQTGTRLPFTANTPYVNTIPPHQQPEFPGNQKLERRIKSLVRWNALSMVVRANKLSDGIGGHISTYASAATLYEVGFNHFFRGRTDTQEPDLVYFQGHAAPGIYARAFLEGRLPVEKLEHFRRELAEGGGLSSYPHPWLMPDFWQFPTVSMGLGPIMSIYQARFNRYLEDRGLKKPSDQKVWAFLGDGETDEPETLGAITLASREKLDNLIFVINCNLQRLDGPVRGNGQIIQELEAIFRGAGWNVLKVIWGSDWDHLLDTPDGLLARRLGEIVDGEYQKYAVESGAYMREHFFGTDPALLDMVRHLSDEELKRMRLGGHDPVKVYAAFKAAVSIAGADGRPGAHHQGLRAGRGGRGQEHHAPAEEAERGRAARLPRPVRDPAVGRGDLARRRSTARRRTAPRFRYLQERRRVLGGYVPRGVRGATARGRPERALRGVLRGHRAARSRRRWSSCGCCASCCATRSSASSSCPIVPDEARTFGMEALFRAGRHLLARRQLYEPVDIDTLLYYKEAKDGQILEEGITEAGSMSSFIAAGTAYATTASTRSRSSSTTRCSASSGSAT
jgi:pyruvate dehydrogenase E1 component